MRKKIGNVIIRMDGLIIESKPIWGDIWKSGDDTWKRVFFVLDNHQRRKMKLVYDKLKVSEYSFKEVEVNGYPYYNPSTWRYTMATKDDRDFYKICDKINGKKLKVEDWELEIVVEKDWKIVVDNYLVEIL